MSEIKNQTVTDDHSVLPWQSWQRWHWLGVIGGWLLLSLLTTAPRFFVTRRSSSEPGFLLYLGMSAAIWLFWALVTPIIFWLGRRLPLQRGKLAKAFLAHLFLSFAFGLLHMACWSGVLIGIETLRTGTTGKFYEAFFSLIQFILYVEVILYWAILGASQALQASRQARERELKAQSLEAQLQQAQLSALKQQLQPHFLFNSLNNISMLVRNGENNQAVQMIAGLGELLRWSLNENAEQEVALKTELETVRRYLAIEQFRFPDRLRVELDVPDELLNATVPNLILQPLVENAVRHGIAKSSSASLIRVSAERQNSALELCVEDDGNGFPDYWRHGVGLSNTRARLARAFGAEAELTIANNETTGACVRLRLPYRPTD